MKKLNIFETYEVLKANLTMIEIKQIKEKELSNFFYCYGESFNLPVDIMFDTDNNFEVYGHKPWMYFRNSYGHEGEFLPIDISDEPRTQYLKPILNIYVEDFYKVVVFVKNNLKVLLDLAKEKISKKTALDILHKKSFSVLDESLLSLNEMAKFSREETGLAGKIWIDNGNAERNSRHSKSDRIKFQNPKEEKDSNGWSSMIIDNLKIINKGKMEWTPEELEDLRKFVKSNSNMIHLAMENNWDEEKILSKLIRIENGELVYPKEEKPYFEVGALGNGFRKIRNKDNKFNALDKYGNIVSPDLWFSHLGTFAEHNNEYALGHCFEEGDVWILYPNGIFRKKV